MALGTRHRSMIFLDGREFTGEPPGLRTVQRGQLMLVYLTDVRGDPDRTGVYHGEKGGR
jgi:hypothetical protein